MGLFATCPPSAPQHAFVRMNLTRSSWTRGSVHGRDTALDPPPREGRVGRSAVASRDEAPAPAARRGGVSARLPE